MTDSLHSIANHSITLQDNYTSIKKDTELSEPLKSETALNVQIEEKL